MHQIHSPIRHMGAVLGTLSSQDMKDIKSRTQFTDDELSNMVKDFKAAAASEVDDGVIDLSEFAHFLKADVNDEKIQHLFKIFDVDKNGFGSLFPPFYPIPQNS